MHSVSRDSLQLISRLSELEEQLAAIRADVASGNLAEDVDQDDGDWAAVDEPSEGDQYAEYELVSGWQDASPGPGSKHGSQEKKKVFYLSSDHIPPWHPLSKPYYVIWTIRPKIGKAVSIVSHHRTTKRGKAWGGVKEAADRSTIRVTLAVAARSLFGARNWIGIEVRWREQ